MCCLHIFGLPSELPFQSSTHCWELLGTTTCTCVQLFGYSWGLLGLFVLAVGAKAIDSTPRAHLPVHCNDLLSEREKAEELRVAVLFSFQSILFPTQTYKTQMQ